MGNRPQSPTAILRSTVCRTCDRRMVINSGEARWNSSVLLRQSRAAGSSDRAYLTEGRPGGSIQVSVNGAWSGPNGGAAGSGTMQFLVSPAGTIAANSTNEFALFDPSSPYYNPINVGPDGTPSLTYTVPVTLNGVNPTIDIAFSLDLTGFLATNQLNQSFNGDFNDTALVSFTPLDDVSFQEPWPRRPYQQPFRSSPPASAA